MSTSVTPGSQTPAQAGSGAVGEPPTEHDGPPGEWPPGDGASGGGHRPERDERGRRFGPAGMVVAGLVAVAFAAGWGVIYNHAGSTPGIASQTITFDIQSDTSVQVRYAVAKSEDDVVRCTVDAFDERFAIVGESRITVPAGVSKITRTDTLRTSKRATGARVKDCHKM
jgi:Domain of unknown function (DUF4307)